MYSGVSTWDQNSKNKNTKPSLEKELSVKVWMWNFVHKLLFDHCFPIGGTGYGRPWKHWGYDLVRVSCWPLKVTLAPASSLSSLTPDLPRCERAVLQAPTTTGQAPPAAMFFPPWPGSQSQLLFPGMTSATFLVTALRKGTNIGDSWSHFLLLGCVPLPVPLTNFTEWGVRM